MNPMARTIRAVSASWWHICVMFMVASSLRSLPAQKPGAVAETTIVATLSS